MSLRYFCQIPFWLCCLISGKTFSHGRVTTTTVCLSGLPDRSTIFFMGATLGCVWVICSLRGIFAKFCHYIRDVVGCIS